MEGAFVRFFLGIAGQNTRSYLAAAMIACAVADPVDSDAQDLSTSTQAPPASRSSYTLFHPTPRSLMRELSTDRPDQTEVPFTVDAGHIQVEMDLVSAVRDVDRSGDARTTTMGWQLAPFNFKIGLMNNVDIHVVISPHQWSRVEDAGSETVEVSSGFGDIATRLKVNLRGNDGGRIALAVMPFVKWPLAASDVRNGRFEGGVIFPWTADLGRGWDLGGMSEVDAVAANGAGHSWQFVNTLVVGRDLAARVGMYVELVSTSGTAGFSQQWQTDIGFTYAQRRNVQLDVGCNIGVNEAAPDFNPFVGVSFKF
jgi:hypothetical protein